jgi:hypothetical protein
MKLNFFDFLLGIFGGLFLTFSRKICFLCSNQAQYLPYGLRLCDPTFIPKDWFTWKAFHHEFAFGYLICFLKKLGSLFITTTIAETIIMIFLSFALLLLAKRFCRYPLPVFFLLIVWLRLVGSNENGLGWQNFISGFLIPAEVAGFLMVFGLAFLLNHRYLISGTAFGVAGLFHATFLSSFGPTILATAFAVGLWRKKKTLLLFAIPLIFFWGIIFAVVANAFLNSPPVPPQTMSIATNLRAPGDFFLSNWSLKWTISWLMWALVGVVSMLILPQKKKFKELKIAFFTVLATNIIGVLVLAFIKIPSLMLLMLWRSSPLVLLLGLLIALDRGLYLVINPKKISTGDKIFVVLSLISATFLLNINWGPQISKSRFLWIASSPLSGLIASLITRFKKSQINRSQIVTASVFATMMFIMTIYLKAYLGKSENYLTNSPSPLAQMEKWVRENTPKDTILVISPDMEYMRLRTQRAVVVDWKATNFRPSDLWEWYKRLSDIAGFPSDTLAPNFESIMKGYYCLDSARAKLLNQLYGAKYVVVLTKEHRGNLSDLRETFANDDYKVLKIPSP